MFKADWYMAYKHGAVRSEDHYLQVIEFCGRLLNFWGEELANIILSASETAERLGRDEIRIGQEAGSDAA